LEKKVIAALSFPKKSLKMTLAIYLNVVLQSTFNVQEIVTN